MENLKISMASGEWWDDYAPYGTHMYSFATGEVVGMTGVRIVREFTITMMPGDPNCVARGVAELTDGRVYQWTVLKPGDARVKGDGAQRRERVRFAHLSRQVFTDAANGLLMSERQGGRVSEEMFAQYRRDIRAL